MAAARDRGPGLTRATVVVTRASEQAGPLVTALTERGFDVIEVPLIRTADPPDRGAALRAALTRPAAWVVATSTNGVQRILAAGGVPPGARVAAVGPASARAFRRAGVAVDLVPDEAVGDALADAFPEGQGRVVLAVAAVTRDVVEAGLRAKGWTVERVEAYRTETIPVDAATRARAGTADAIAFLSPSAVRGWCASRTSDGEGDVGGPIGDLPPVVVCIGPVTAEAAVAARIDPVVVADPHTVDGVVAALESMFP